VDLNRRCWNGIFSSGGGAHQLTHTHNKNQPNDGIGEESPNNPSFFHSCSGWSQYAKSEILNGWILYWLSEIRCSRVLTSLTSVDTGAPRRGAVTRSVLD